MSTLGVFSASGDIMMYAGAYHIGGYYQYIGGIS